MKIQSKITSDKIYGWANFFASISDVTWFDSPADQKKYITTFVSLEVDEIYTKIEETEEKDLEEISTNIKSAEQEKHEILNNTETNYELPELSLYKKFSENAQNVADFNQNELQSKQKATEKIKNFPLETLNYDSKAFLKSVENLTKHEMHTLNILNQIEKKWSKWAFEESHD